MEVGSMGQEKLSEKSREALQALVDQVAADHTLSNGSTALYWHLVGIIGDAIEDQPASE